MKHHANSKTLAVLHKLSSDSYGQGPVLASASTAKNKAGTKQTKTQSSLMYMSLFDYLWI